MQSTEVRTSLDLTATFPNEAAAREAIDVLNEARVDHELSLPPQKPGREENFLARLAFSIAAWSVLGGAVGVGLGTMLWLAVGPSGTNGFIIQAIVWGIFGHLIIGLWAGYLQLADRTGPELPIEPPPGPAVLTIHCPDPATRDYVVSVLPKHGARLSEPID